MKNKINKFLSGLMAVLLMAFMVMPTNAAERTATITNEIVGHSFTAYQIFKGDAVREDKNGTISFTETEEDSGILSNIKWGNGIDADTFVEALNSKFSSANLSASDPEKVAKWMSELNNQDAITVAQIAFNHTTDTGVPIDAATMDGNKIVSVTKSVDQGYYLIVDTTSGLNPGDAKNPAVLAVNGDVEIKNKKEEVTVEKQVKNETETSFAEGTNSSIGKTVTFKLSSQIINAKALSNYTQYYMEFSDTASSALDPAVDDAGKVIFKAYLVDADNENNLVDSNLISGVFTSTSVAGTGSEFRTFSFTAENILAEHSVNDLAGKFVVITYEATLNNNAVIGSVGNLNEVVLNYSNNPNSTSTGTPETGTTDEDEAIVFTFKLDATKVALENEEKLLEDARFVVYRKTADETKEFAVMDENKKVTEWTPLPSEPTDYDLWNRNMVIISSEAGEFGISGLGNGTYYLQEIKAPAGYNLSSSDFEFKINSTIDTGDPAALATLNITVGTKTTNGTVNTGIVTTKVENSKGTTLPETGGMGTTMLYIAGAILLIGSGVLLVTRKRMKSN